MQQACFYCGSVVVKFVSNKKHRLNPPNGKTRDHLIPHCRGGKALENNTVTCCTTCNNDKGRLTLEEYRAAMAIRYGLLKEVPFKFKGE